MTRRGEIYYVDWTPGRGSEQRGARPALIIQNDVGNRFSSTTIVAAISSHQDRVYPFQVQIKPYESGLPRDSIVKCEQIQTIDQARLGARGGMLDAAKMLEVEGALHRSLGIES